MNAMLANYPEISQRFLTIKAQNIDYQRQKLSRKPKLQFQLNSGALLGRTIDPTTNTFSNRFIGFNSIGLEGRWALFDGGRHQRTLQEKSAQLFMAQQAYYDAIFMAKAQVIQAFMNVLLSQEQLERAILHENQMNIRKEYIALLIENGVKPAIENIQLEAQLTQRKQAVLKARSHLIQTKNQLRFLVGWSGHTSFELVKPSVNESFHEIDYFSRKYTSWVRFP